jgi:citrate synthase
MIRNEEPLCRWPWLQQALVDKRKITDFGHRVYKNGDARVPTMRTATAGTGAAADRGS